VTELSQMVGSTTIPVVYFNAKLSTVNKVW
jgi:hypothetical protein